VKEEPDYYTVLQVSPDAEMEVIQAAYRRLAAKYHPDVDPSPGAVERMKLLNAAYEVLSNPEKRGAYDMSRARGWRQQTAGDASTRQRPWWFAILAGIVLLLLLRFNPRLLLILGPMFLILWLLLSWQPRRK